MGTITRIRRDDNAIWYTISADASLLRYVVEKGSITLDGISLTVASVSARDCCVSVIPHTQAHTNLITKHVGDVVNIECDLIGKYVEKLLQAPLLAQHAQTPSQTSSRTSPRTSSLDKAFLEACGF